MTNPADKSATPAAKRVPIIMGLADLTQWEVGPTKESDCSLTFKVSIKNWEDVATVRNLALGQVVVRVMPLQLTLPEGIDCKHPEMLRMAFGPTQSVCLECGQILDVPADDQKSQADKT